MYMARSKAVKIEGLTEAEVPDERQDIPQKNIL